MNKENKGCSCGFKLEKGKEGCGEVIDELVEVDDDGEMIDTVWIHCGEGKELCDDCERIKQDALSGLNEVKGK